MLKFLHLVHSLANGLEVTEPLLETSRKGYLAAISASSYSFVSLLQNFLPIMNPDTTRIFERSTILGATPRRQAESVDTALTRLLRSCRLLCNEIDSPLESQAAS
ncbi:enoyl-[acyl-carrier-protein] reductase [NADH] 2, chloroplastic-like [Asparagus officinalis]|uniref:enoyl-[acyl-carrier-protein] reductase [NADH] 2, chloroplastic-like n=1 Tax=Asparagus officinalis TaxID=4686 RepID=UPI00098E5C33|nr:enoyl-[acyl-carrier-protein] reductase [NADH] 2, chloroplastic-like [Asparagus officinalis]